MKKLIVAMMLSVFAMTAFAEGEVKKEEHAAAPAKAKKKAKKAAKAAATAAKEEVKEEAKKEEAPAAH